MNDQHIQIPFWIQILGLSIFLIVAGFIIISACLPSRKVIDEPTSDIHEEPEYQNMVEELASQCTCTGMCRPCDGLLAGGTCDDIHLDGDRDVDANDD